MSNPQVTINQEQQLYVVPADEGYYSCLGFDVLDNRAKTIAAWLGAAAPVEPVGTAEAWEEYRKLTAQALARFNETDTRCPCELTPQLVGLERRRVEVETHYGERRRFQVGKSTGWMPCHLELANARSSGGSAAEASYKSVRVVR